MLNSSKNLKIPELSALKDPNKKNLTIKVIFLFLDLTFVDLRNHKTSREITENKQKNGSNWYTKIWNCTKYKVEAKC
jgi:hypothetical protein